MVKLSVFGTLLLGSFALASTESFTSGNDDLILRGKGGNKWKEMEGAWNHFSELGNCFLWVDTDGLKDETDRKYSKDICKKKCVKEYGEPFYGASCFVEIPSGVDLKKAELPKDPNGRRYMIGDCGCDMTFAQCLSTEVLKGFKDIDKAICVAWLEAFKTAGEIVAMAVPGGGAVSFASKVAKAGAKAATKIKPGVELVKTLGDNAVDAKEANSLVGLICGVPEFKGLDGMLWDTMTGTSSELGSSQGKYTNCSEYREKKVGERRRDTTAEQRRSYRLF